MATCLPGHASLFWRLFHHVSMYRAWAPDEDALLPEEDIVELSAMVDVHPSPPPASKAALSDAPEASAVSAVGAVDLAVIVTLYLY